MKPPNCNDQSFEKGAGIGGGSARLLTRLETEDDAVGLAQRLAEQVGPNAELSRISSVILRVRPRGEVFAVRHHLHNYEKRPAKSRGHY